MWTAVAPFGIDDDAMAAEDGDDDDATERFIHGFGTARRFYTPSVGVLTALFNAGSN